MQKTGGFTLVELIVVIAITAILLAVVVPNAFKAVMKAKIAQVMADTTNFRAAATGYYSDIGLWPPDVCPDEDPGFVTWNAYQTRCCGQDYDVLEDMAYDLDNESDYDTIIHNYWDGPYLEKFPSPTPWGGSYDWEFWPHEPSWAQPSGVYVSVRQKYNTVQRGTGCGIPSLPYATTVPPDYEVKMQQQGIDVHCSTNFPNSCNDTNKNIADGLVIIPVIHFNITH